VAELYHDLDDSPTDGPCHSMNY